MHAITVQPNQPLRYNQALPARHHFIHSPHEIGQSYKLSTSRHHAAVSPSKIFVLRIGEAVAAAEHRMSITEVIDVYVSAEKCNIYNHQKEGAQRATRQARSHRKMWVAHAPCKCRDSPFGQSKAQRPCTKRLLLNIKTSPYSATGREKSKSVKKAEEGQGGKMRNTAAMCDGGRDTSFSRIFSCGASDMN